LNEDDDDDDDEHVTPYNTPFGTPIKSNSSQLVEKDVAKKLLNFQENDSNCM